MQISKLLILFLLNMAYLSPALSAPCPNAPLASQVPGPSATIQMQWQLNGRETWLQEYRSGPFPELRSYQEFTAAQTTIDPLALIARQREIYATAYGLDSAEVKTFLAIENGDVGRIQSLNCLSALLMNQHLKFNPLNVPGSEFAATVLVRGDAIKIFAAFIKGGSMRAPLIDLPDAQLKKLQSEGWNWLAFLHNHSFAFDNEYGDIAGTVVPSDPDINTFAEQIQWGTLSEAWITNGFHTGIFKPFDVQLLQAIK